MAVSFDNNVFIFLVLSCLYVFLNVHFDIRVLFFSHKYFNESSYTISLDIIESCWIVLEQNTHALFFGQE